MNEKLPFFSPPAELAPTCVDLYQQAFENSTDCLALFAIGADARLRFIEANPAMERLLGLPRSELLGQCLDERLPEAIASRITTGSQACIATGTLLNDEYELELPIGRRYCLHSLIPLRDADGRTANFLHIVRDITESKLRAEQLLSDKLAFRTLAEHTPDTIARYDRDLLRTYANPAFARMIGLSATDVLGKKPSHVSSTPEILAYEATLLEVVRSGHPDEHELAWQGADGRQLISHIRIVPERAADGEVISVLAAGRDITELRRAEQALRIREQEFRTLVENSPDVIVRYDREGRRVYINPAFEQLYGIPACDVIGTPITHGSPLPQELTSRYHKGILDVMQSAQPVAVEATWTKANGEQVVQHVRAVPEFDSHGQVASVLTIARDISALKTTERRLEQAESLARLGHWQMDYRRGTLRLSAELCRLADKPRGWAPGLEEVRALLVSEDHVRIIETIKLAIVNRTEELQLDYRIETGQSKLNLYSHLCIEYAEDGTPLQLFGTAQDISEIKAYQQQLHTMAFYDSLTELPNRELFKERLQQAITQASRYDRQVAVAILDLDNFKVINDTLGHSAGDDLLQETARRLQRSVRDSDTVARLGGDEFALIMPQAAGVCLTTLAGKLLQAISGIYPIQGRELFISGSIGIACYPGDAGTISELLQYADSAMYHAKEQGRNNVQVYSPQLIQTTTERMALAASLRDAQHNGELEVHYQPQIDLASGRLIGAEALLRWNHPRHGQVPPDTFIPIAEETGLIVGIGEWVLRKACQVAVAWNRGDRHPALKIAVNLSPRQFRMNDLPKAIRAILQDTGCEPRWLTLEITEGLLLDNNIAVREILERLFDMGLTIAIDDFGTGYSALGYLSRFPVEILKIDRSFIRGIDHHRESVELVKAIISMAHALGMTLVAEGVEESSQQAFLQRSGCHSAQGYLYGKAMPQEDFERLLLYKAGMQ
ncbi:EAL domain-containing protein [Pseudomonas sp. NPDC087697]|uniref:EAL domain-containing protein n=1 Tax=Pseudomonas sp. NPDC087697 TaxID=3364447 RepID=UPI0037F3F931